MSYWIDEFLKVANNTESPDVYFEWAGVSIVAGVLQRKPYFILNEFNIYPNLYVAIVGPPGCRKGAPIRTAKKYLNRLGINLAADSITKEQLYNDMNLTRFEKDGNKFEGSFGALSILTPDDLGGSPDTAQTANDMVEGTFSALSLISSELATFLNTGDDKFFTVLTEWFDCEEDWKYKTKNKGSNSIKNVWFNILGAITPKLIGSTLSATAFGSGLMSRFLFIYASKKSKIIMMDTDSIVGGSKDMSVDNRAKFEELIDELSRIQMIRGRFLMEVDAFKVYTKWRLSNENDPPFGNNPHFEHYIDRRPTHLIKLALIFACMRSDTTPEHQVITLTDLTRAIQMLHKAEDKMGLTFRGIGEYDKAKSIAKLIRIMVGKNTPETIDKVTGEVTEEVLVKTPINELFALFLNEMSYTDFTAIVNSCVMGKIFKKYVNKTSGLEKVCFNEEMRKVFDRGEI